MHGEATAKLRRCINKISRYVVLVCVDDFYVWGAVFSGTVGHRLCDLSSANLAVEKEVLLDPEADLADWLLFGVSHGACSFCASRQGESFLPKYQIKCEINCIQLNARSFDLYALSYTLQTIIVYALMALTPIIHQ